MSLSFKQYFVQDKSGVIRIAVANIQLRRLLAGMPVGNLSVASNSAMSGWTGPSPQSAFHPFSSSNKSNQNGKSPADAAEDENNGKKPPKSEARVEELKQFAINVFQTLSGFLIILDHVGKIVSFLFTSKFYNCVFMFTYRKQQRFTWDSRRYLLAFQITLFHKFVNRIFEHMQMLKNSPLLHDYESSS